MKVSRRPWHWLALGLISMVVLTLSLAPWQGSLQRAGSSYNRAPDGYGAWYHYMQNQANVCIGRWHHPIADLNTPGTLIQIDPEPETLYLSDSLFQWVKQGNTLIRLGVKGTVTAAPFTANLASETGRIKLETRRRQSSKRPHEDKARGEESVLSDSYGTVIWQWSEGKGKVIAAVTPYLAANAYQDQPGNFKFLAGLATPKQGVIWMDEYTRGFTPESLSPDQANPQASSPTQSQDPLGAKSPQCQALLAQAKSQPSSKPKAQSPDPFLYLLKTPIGLILLQGLIAVSLLIVAQNRRFGLPQPLVEKSPDNTTAYIHALATVLQKANCHGFVVETLHQAEQRQLQQRLALGDTLLDPDQVLETWTQMGYPPSVLQQVLLHHPSEQCSEQELLTWLQAWRRVRSELN